MPIPIHMANDYADLYLRFPHYASHYVVHMTASDHHGDAIIILTEVAEACEGKERKAIIHNMLEALVETYKETA